MGGFGAHEYMAPSPAGEDRVALCDGCDYASNVEMAVSVPRPRDVRRRARRSRRCRRRASAPSPSWREFLGIDEGTDREGGASSCRRTSRAAWCWRSCAATTACTSSSSARCSARRTDPRHAGGDPRGVRRRSGLDRRRRHPPTARSREIVVDATLREGGYVVGANNTDYHLRNAEHGRDFTARVADIRARRGGRHVRPLRRRAAHRADDRGRQHLQARHALLRADGRDVSSTRTARSSRSGWAPTASARRASWRRPSSSSPTTAASSGRRRSRRSTSGWCRSATRRRRAADRLPRPAPRRSASTCMVDDRDAVARACASPTPI